MFYTFLTGHGWRASLLLLLAVGVLALDNVPLCYYPNGLSPSSNFACNLDANVSACCAIGDICLDNGFCGVGGLDVRGSCTDRLWQSPECPQHCVGMSSMPTSTFTNF